MREVYPPFCFPSAEMKFALMLRSFLQRAHSSVEGKAVKKHHDREEGRQREGLEGHSSEHGMGFTHTGCTVLQTTHTRGMKIAAAWRSSSVQS